VLVVMRYPQNWCALVNVFYQRRCKDTVFVWYCVCVCGCW